MSFAHKDQSRRAAENIFSSHSLSLDYSEPGPPLSSVQLKLLAFPENIFQETKFPIV
jgi:hypothetical protein